MKKLKILLAVTFLSAGLASCKPKVVQHSVHFKDGETVLRTVKVDDGAKVSRPTDLETKSGFEFRGWYATPTFSHDFDFEKVIKEETTVFGAFSQFVEDARDWYILGSGKSNLLVESQWGTKITPTMKLVKTEGKNEFKITTDLLVGDEWQFGGPDWIHKRGYGYLETTKLPDGTVAFSGSGGLGEVTAKGRNIKVELAGNYTITLTTSPGDDYYDVDQPNYTEETKEIYNIGVFDRISFVRNGDPMVVQEAVTDYYIKGAKITDWKDVYNNLTKMKRGENDIYTQDLYLVKGEEFLFTSTNTVGDVVSVGTSYLRYTNLDEASKPLFTAGGGQNLVVVDDGTYSFSYNAKTEVLSVTRSADETDQSKLIYDADFYLAGTFGEDKWNQITADSVNADYRLVNVKDNDYKATFEYELVVDLAADEEFIVEALVKGAEGRGEWGSEEWAQLGTFNYTYLVPNSLFAPVSATNKNVKALEAGTYKITYNAYTRSIKITDATVTYDIYIKGAGINEWKHEFSADYRFAMDDTNSKLYEFTLVITEPVEFGLEIFESGATEGYGILFVNHDFVGGAGDANALFTAKEGGKNIVASELGTYKIVIDISVLIAPVVSFYTVTA